MQPLTRICIQILIFFHFVWERRHVRLCERNGYGERIVFECERACV